MNVFVLCTGRCGSVTFARACEHLTNYTVGHESRSAYLGPERLKFPDNHIEADLRLSWYLGLLGEQYGRDAFYVHLTRDPHKVASSYLNKLQVKAHGQARAWYEITRFPKSERWPNAMLDMVTAINANIRYYLRDKDHISVDIDSAAASFPSFCQRIGAEGDVSAGVREFSVHYNASPKQTEEVRAG